MKKTRTLARIKSRVLTKEELKKISAGICVRTTQVIRVGDGGWQVVTDPPTC